MKNGQQMSSLQDGCAFVYLDDRYSIMKTTKNCLDFRKHVSSIIDHYEKIVIIQRWSGVLQNVDTEQRELKNTFQYLLNKNKKVYLFQDNPDTGFLIQRNHHLQQRGVIITPLISLHDMRARIEAVHTANQTIKK